MKYRIYLLSILFFLLTCKTKEVKDAPYSNWGNIVLPDKTPLDFKPELVAQDQLIHRAIFSPDFKQFYYTTSNKDFSNFTVHSIEINNGQWSEPQEAFFNSSYDDHGMSFSPDGNTIYFSSTRPTNHPDVPNTWHLWQTKKINGKWQEAEWIDIPKLRSQLVSHPSVTQFGRLYFHVSTLDYDEMQLYYADQVDGKFVEAKPVSLPTKNLYNKCTPFISPHESYLIYAEIEEQLELMICTRDENGFWTPPKKLNTKINYIGQGNPFVTIDQQFLFFTTGTHALNQWNIKWVRMEGIVAN